MKKFQFKLASLLKYRKYLERLAQQETARAQLDVKKCEDAIQQLRIDFIRQSDQLRDALTKGMTASEFKRSHNYMDAVENQLEDEKRHKVQLTEILKGKVEELKKKSVDKKVMELYRDRKKTAYAQEFLMLEQKELDEISSLKCARTASNETN